MIANWQKRPAPGVGRARSRAAMASREIETSHDAASLNAKDMASWPTFRLSPDAALLPEMDTISARVDDLVRNNGIAAGAERTFVDNVVGPRIVCKPDPDRVALGKDAAWSDEWSRQVESLFRSFTDTDWFDAGLRYNFHVSTRLQARTIAATGEALALPLWTRRNGSRWNTCLQLIDPARLSQPMGKVETAIFRGGIELDPVTTAATAYHIRKSHPGDVIGFANGWGAGEWERIPAYQTWGRRRVVHLFESERVGQTRGKAVVTSVARQFRMLDKMNTEQLRLAVLNSLVFAALETPLEPGAVNEIFDSGDPELTPMQNYQQQLNEWRVQMRGGSIISLPPGTSMKPFAPNQQMTGLDTFATVMLRSIGAGLNMPYELIFRDFSKTNYSSARASLLEAWRYFASVRQFLIDHWCNVIFDLWFEEAVNRGMIPDCTPDDYYGNQIAWTRCKWIFAGRGWVDPFKEARAADQRLKSGVSTLADEAGEQGRDWRDQIEQSAREEAVRRDARRAYGLPDAAEGSADAAASSQDDEDDKEEQGEADA